MNEKQREAVKKLLRRKTADLVAVGPTAAKRLGRARFIGFSDLSVET